MNAIERLNLKSLSADLQDAMICAHDHLGDGESFNVIRAALLQGEADAKELAAIKERAKDKRKRYADAEYGDASYKEVVADIDFIINGEKK